MEQQYTTPDKSGSSPFHARQETVQLNITETRDCFVCVICKNRNINYLIDLDFDDYWYK